MYYQMSSSSEIPSKTGSFSVIGAEAIAKIINSNYSELHDLIVNTYLLHHSEHTLNPDSYFLRYPDAPRKRIIALPAHIGGETNVSGIKWIASNPANIDVGIQRASAVLILNDGETGFPFACLESGIISATRTVISAVASLYYLNSKQTKVGRVGIIGNGFIARNFVDALHAMNWNIEGISLYDLNPLDSNSLKDYIEGKDLGAAKVESKLENLVKECDVVVTTTTAGAPYINDVSWFEHAPIVLNISLRDFGEDVILNANNVMDDINHCLKADTSPHLAFKKSGNKDFINGHIGQVFDGSIKFKKGKPIIFSPFGLGVLDIALGYFVYNEAREQQVKEQGLITDVPNFFGDQTRW